MPLEDSSHSVDLPPGGGPPAGFPIRAILLGLLVLGIVALPVGAQTPAAELDENCVVSAFNRTAPVQEDGSWVLPSLPSNLGPVRIRATCVENGVTRFGQSPLVAVPTNEVLRVPEISFDDPLPIPERIALDAPVDTLTELGATTQVTVSAFLPGGVTVDVTVGVSGTSYSTSRAEIATVSVDGLVTAVSSGTVLLTATYEGTVGFLLLQVVTSGDSDGDGLPDDFEIASGLDPNNPADAVGDADADGLTNLEEFQAGLDLFNPDTDGDTLLDGEEGGFDTDPLLFDTDGDGLSDGLEVQLGTDPTDPDDFDLAGALVSITVSPANFNLIFNTVFTESSVVLTVLGSLIDGTTLDLTARGTNFTSTDLAVCSFGVEPGRVFAGTDGSCTVTATNSSLSADAVGTVSTFSPMPLSQLPVPGTTENVDVAGDFLYIAAGTAGLQVADVADRTAPRIVGSADTPGFARIIKVAGSVAYVADGASGLRIFDVSLPESPTLLGTLNTLGVVRDVEIRGDLAYLAAGSEGLQIVDVSDPSSPQLVGSVGALGSLGTFHGVDVEPELGLVVAAAGAGGLRVIDVSVPVSPVVLGTASIGGNAQDVVLRGAFAHVADLSRSLTVVDLLDPRDPNVGVSTPRATGGLLNDVERLGDLVFGADVFFFNGVPIINVAVPESPLPTAILDFRSFGDDNGAGLAVDGQHVYLATDRSRILIGQYLSLQDNEGLPPTVEIISPGADTTPLAGSTLDVLAEASDDIAVLQVDFLVDGEVVHTDFTRPYVFPLAVPVGSAVVTLGARVLDFGNNQGEAEEITLTVLPDVESPVFGTVEPAAGTPFGSGDELTVSAEVSDNVSVTAVNFEVGSRTFVDTVAPYAVTLATPPVFETTDLAIRIEASDPSGNVGSFDFTVPVEPLVDLEAPRARILAPGDGDLVLAGLELTVDLAIEDNLFLDAYTLSIDGEVIGSEFFIGQSTFTDQVVLRIPEDAAPGQTFTLRLEASDFGGNVDTAEATLEVISAEEVLTGEVTLDSSSDGQSLVLGGGTFTVVEPIAPQSLILLSGARVVGTTSEPLRLEVAGDLAVGGGAVIDVSGLGFPGSGASGSSNGGAPAGLAASTPDAGGSHGGVGVRFDSGTAGEVYDSVYVPQLSGGGGARDQDGVGDGRPGGGVVEIFAGNLRLNGEILARGLGDQSNRAGGAGGSVLIDTPELSGGGTIDASGGATSPCCTSQRTGSGGGGRIALYADRLVDFDPRTQALARGGARREINSQPSSFGAPGTVYLLRADSTYGDLLIDPGERANGADRTGPPTELPELGTGDILSFDALGADALVGSTAPFRERFLGAFLRLLDVVGTDLGVFQVTELDPSGGVRLAGAGGVTGAATFLGEYRFDRVELRNSGGLSGTTPIETEVFRVEEGTSRLPSSIVTRDFELASGVRATLASGGRFEGRVAGTMTVEAGSLLDVSGLGFPGSGVSGSSNGGAPAGLAASTPDAGGSHGGVGNGFDGGTAGEVYDSVYAPQLSGGGGARDQDGVGEGFAGGGVIELAVGELVLDGELRARGLGDVSNRAGGAGGSVWIDAARVSGGGVIDVSGGDTAPCCNSQRTGAGGGGRVALYIDELASFDPVSQVRARGGARREINGVASSYAAPGTIFVHRSGTSTFGDLLIDSGEDGSGADRSGPSTELPRLGGGAISTFENLGADARVTAAVPFRTRFEGAFLRLLDAGGSLVGTFRVVEIDAAGRAILQGAGAVLAATSFEGEYRFDSVELRNGADILSRDPVEGMDIEVLPGNSKLPASFMVTNLTLRSGAHVTVAEGGRLRGTVSGTMTLEAGSTLDVSGLGFPGSGASGSSNGGAPAGIIASTSDAGGSHGGVGNRFNSGAAGEVYDSVYLPQLSGGGGARDEDGVGEGLAGGGVIELTVGDLVLDGEILARGLGDDTNRAGGAGGSVLIDATRILGGGRIDVSGGSTLPCCNSQRTGAGGGGRVAVYVDELAGFDPVTQIRALGGTRREIDGSANGFAAPGTIFVHTTSSIFGDLLIDSGETDVGEDRVGPSTELPLLGAGAVVELVPLGADALVGAAESFLPRFVGAYLRLFDAAGTDLGLFLVSELDELGRARLVGAGGVVGAVRFAGEYRFDRIELRNGAGILSQAELESTSMEVFAGTTRWPNAFRTGNLTVRAGAFVTLTQGGRLQLTVDGTLTVEPGAVLDVSGRGFPGSDASGSSNGGAPEGLAPSTSDAGGSHGGVGTRFDSGAAGEVYDSVYVPQLPGGGGSRDQDGVGDGFAGGGVIDIRAGALVLDGEIRARGLGGASNRAGGAGGTVLLEMATISGSGSIDASGGSSAPCCNTQRTGSGGGGRVAIYADRLLGFDPVVQVRVRGGARREINGQASNHGAPGTFFLHTSTSIFGDLLIDNGEDESGGDRSGPTTELPFLGSGAITSATALGGDAILLSDADFRDRHIGAHLRLLDAGGNDLGTFRATSVAGDGSAVVAGAAAVAGSVASYVGVYRFDRVDLRNGTGILVRDVLESTQLVIEAGSSELPAELTAGDLTLRSGAVVTVAEGASFRGTVSGTLTIEAGSRLDVSGRGFPGSGASGSSNGGAPANVSPSTPDAGGSHGGLGIGFDSGSGGEAYDSAFLPQIAGAGGARDQDGVGDGFAGGGTIELMAGSLVLEGEIRARGLGDSSNRAGGAGGSVLIEAATLSGAGTIDVSGGSTSPCCTTQRTGSGGGGRIALYVDQFLGFDPALQTLARGGARREINGQPTGFAGPGTVFVQTVGSIFGDLLVDQGGVSGEPVGATPLPHFGAGTLGSTEVDTEDPAALWIEPQDPAVFFDVGITGMWVRISGIDYRVLAETSDRRRALLDGAASAASTGDSYEGVYKFDTVTVRGGAVVVFDDRAEAGTFDVDSESTVTLNVP